MPSERAEKERDRVDTFLDWLSDASLEDLTEVLGSPSLRLIARCTSCSSTLSLVVPEAAKSRNMSATPMTKCPWCQANIRFRR